MSIPPKVDLKAAMEMLQPGHSAKSVGVGTTSDLSIDETLLVHSIGWEPVDLVLGVSWWSVPWGSWTYRTGEITEASSAFAGAVEEAVGQLRAECASVGGAGVVGVEIELTVRSHHIALALSGTAIRPIEGHAKADSGTSAAGLFVSDLSARDFALLTTAGWWPVGLAAGASFVAAPRRSARQWAAQKGLNMEMPHLTEALYDAREGAMGRMQAAGLEVGAEGIVAVKLREGPLSASATMRIMQFIALGTGVVLRADSHRRMEPTMVVSLNDGAPSFAAESLRGASKS